jgi:TatD DNase family protein
VLHCFTETWEMAQAAIELGMYISISGIVTFKTATELQEVVKNIPLDKLLIETDSPWLAPVPHRGKPNQPGFVREVAEFIANLKGISVDELANITTNNFYDLFAIKRAQ